MGKLWEIVGRLWGSRLWERPCQLPLIREIVGRLKNNEIICGKFVGRPGREILFFLSFFWWFGASAPLVFVVVCVMSPTPPQSRRDLYIYIYIHGPRQTAAAKSSRAPTSAHEHIYIYVYINTDVLNMRLHLVEIYQNTERSKTFKNTTCSTYRRTCPTYSVRSISRISLLMLLISISSVTGLISKKTQGRNAKENASPISQKNHFQPHAGIIIT